MSVMMKELQYENETLKEKCSNLKGMINSSNKGHTKESEKLLLQLDVVKGDLTTLKHERDQVRKLCLNL